MTLKHNRNICLTKELAGTVGLEGSGSGQFPEAVVQFFTPQVNSQSGCNAGYFQQLVNALATVQEHCTGTFIDSKTPNNWEGQAENLFGPVCRDVGTRDDCQGYWQVFTKGYESKLSSEAQKQLDCTLSHLKISSHDNKHILTWFIVIAVLTLLLCIGGCYLKHCCKKSKGGDNSDYKRMDN